MIFHYKEKEKFPFKWTTSQLIEERISEGIQRKQRTGKKVSARYTRMDLFSSFTACYKAFFTKRPLLRGRCLLYLRFHSYLFPRFMLVCFFFSQVKVTESDSEVEVGDWNSRSLGNIHENGSLVCLASFRRFFVEIYKEYCRKYWAIFFLNRNEQFSPRWETNHPNNASSCGCHNNNTF